MPELCFFTFLVCLPQADTIPDTMYARHLGIRISGDRCLWYSSKMAAYNLNIILLLLSSSLSPSLRAVAAR